MSFSARSKTGMGVPKFNSVEDYVASLAPIKAGTIRTVLDLILTEFPELASKMAWNVPHIHRNGKYVAGLAAYRNHLTFAPWSPRVLDAFRQRLEKYVVFKNCFQIPIDWQPDRQLLTDMVRARLAELD
jgi:uncharacterized protein